MNVNRNVHVEAPPQLQGQEQPTFGQALKQSWANTFEKSKALGVLRVAANLTIVGALIDLAASGISHAMGRLGRNAQPVPPVRLSQNQEVLSPSPSLRESFSGSSVLESSSGPSSSSSTSSGSVAPWKPVKGLPLDKTRLDTPRTLCPPSRPQTGTSGHHTKAFEALFEAGITFGVPGKAIGQNKKEGNVTIDGKEYQYEATGKVAKGSGAGIWMVKLQDLSNDAEPTEFVIKANPKKWDDSDEFMLQFSQVGREKDLTEVQILDLMSGNDHALHFHGGYSLDNGTLVYGMEKAQGDMLEVLDSRIESQKEGTLDIRSEDQHLLQMARAVADLHSTGQVHGDVKSDNFMLGTDGTARIADFGESYVTDPGVREETLKGDVQRYATMAFNLRQGAKETTDTLPGVIRKEQDRLEEDVTLKLSSMIHNQRSLISQMEKEGGDLEIIGDLKRQLNDLEDPTKWLDTMISLSGKDLDESVRTYAINKLLLEAVSTPKPGLEYMGTLAEKLERLVG